MIVGFKICIYQFFRKKKLAKNLDIILCEVKLDVGTAKNHCMFGQEKLDLLHHF